MHAYGQTTLSRGTAGRRINATNPKSPMSPTINRILFGYLNGTDARLRTSICYVVEYFETGSKHARLNIGLADFGYTCEELDCMKVAGKQSRDILI